MGKSLAENFPAAAQCFEEADDSLGFSISKICFGRPRRSTQADGVSVAARLLLAGIDGRLPGAQDRGGRTGLRGRPQSRQRILTALSVAAGIARLRRRLAPREQARSLYAGSRARRRGRHGRTLLKLPPDKLDEILAAAAQGEVVTPAGFNSPDQIVIAGNKGAVERAMDLAKSRRREACHCPARQRALSLSAHAPGPAAS